MHLNLENLIIYIASLDNGPRSINPTKVVSGYLALNGVCITTIRKKNFIDLKLCGKNMV
jgi:hypothetical protein